MTKYERKQIKTILVVKFTKHSSKQIHHKQFYIWPQAVALDLVEVAHAGLRLDSSSWAPGSGSRSCRGCPRWPSSWFIVFGPGQWLSGLVGGCSRRPWSWFLFFLWFFDHIFVIFFTVWRNWHRFGFSGFSVFSTAAKLRIQNKQMKKFPPTFNFFGKN